MRCIFWKRKISLGYFSVGYSMVRCAICPLIHTYFVRSIYRSGIVIILFFQCMGTLLDHVIRTRGGIKWGLLAYTVAVFSFVTIFTVTALNVQLVSYVEFREVPDGPLFYHPTATEEWLAVMPEVVFSLNQWLADGLLVSSALNSAVRMSEVDPPLSCTVVTLFMP